MQRALDTLEGIPDAVRFRVESVTRICGGSVLSLRELKDQAKRYAKQGCDPESAGIVELGLLLSEDDYASLKSYVRRLDVNRPKVRRQR